MSDHLRQGSSRRSFLKRAAAALTTLGVIVAAPVWVLKGSGGSDTAGRSVGRARAESEPLVAYVRDAGKGEVVLLAGSREVVVRDPNLVSHLVRCCEA